MTVPEILKELEPYTGRFPREAMEAAIEQREAITPELLSVVEAAAADPLSFAKPSRMLHLFALFLLAQFREKRAYPPIVRMFSAPGDTSYDLAGETAADGLDRILGSVYDGNPALLQGLVENDDADEFVRASAIHAFLVLLNSSQIARDEVVDYFRSLFHGKLKRTGSYAWNGLVCAVANLPAPELLGEVQRAFDDNLVDDSADRLADIEGDLAAADPQRRQRYKLITNAIDDMEWWVAFHPEPIPDPEEAPDPQVPFEPPTPPAPVSYEPPQPFIREPKIGRNDPCPCGSGKKYKKCCGTI